MAMSGNGTAMSGGAAGLGVKRSRSPARSGSSPASSTPRNAQILRQLEDPALRLVLLELPGALLAQAVKTPQPGARQALLVQTGLAIEMLLTAPMRLGNLQPLRLGVHLVRGPAGKMQLIISGEEVKNGVPIASQLPPEFCRLLDIYVKRFRPLIGAKGGDWLFPGKSASQPKSADGLRAAIETTTAKWIDVKLNPHVFRHFAALIILRRNPAAYGLVQRVLFHDSLQSTMTSYSGLESTTALEFYDDLIAEERARKKRK